MILVLAASAARAASRYDQTILGDRPVLFLSMDSPGAAGQPDLSGHGNDGAYRGGTPGVAIMPNGERAAEFNGSSQYLSVPASPALSVPTRGALTIEAWIRPATLQFPNTEAEDYVYFIGKGDPSNGYEYANRMYSLNNSAGRPNRISDYAWNTSGGLGSGSYFQDTVTTTQWILVTDVIDMRSGIISIYKNGVLRKTTPLSQYNVTPGVTNSPFNVGTRNYNSWFKGAIGKVAVYDRVLGSAEIAGHYAAMSLSAAPAAPGPAPGAPAPAPGEPTPPSVSLEHLAPQRFLSPALADGLNDRAVFGPGAAEVTILDVRGRRVFGAVRQSGPIVWTGRDFAGRLVESGAYLAQILKDDGRLAYQSFAVVR